MDEEGVIKTEENSLLVELEFGVKKLPAIGGFREISSRREGGRKRGVKVDVDSGR